MKSTQNFKMTKTNKRLISTIVDANARNVFRQNMIQAQLQSEVKPEPEKKRK